MTRHFFKKLILALAMMGLLPSSLSLASSVGDPTVLPGSTQVGQPASGSDMWTQTMAQLGLFRVHRNNCDDTGTAPTEIFVKVYSDDNSVDFGFCMDKDEHSAGSKRWHDARDECLEDGKRLPESGELIYAICNVTGLNNIGEDYEWSSNFKFSVYRPGNISSTYAEAVQSCTHAGFGFVGAYNGDNSSFPFRCVR